MPPSTLSVGCHCRDLSRLGGNVRTSAVARWARENPRSSSLHYRAARLLPGGVTHDVRLAEPFPLAVARADGARKWDADGHQLVCYVMGHGALLLGHGHPEVIAAIREQAGRALHPGACHELECEWADLVVNLVPSADRVRFTSSGTEASLLALRLALAATGRAKVVKLSGHFHGWHDQMATGSDPPFDRPDTAGLPAAVADTTLVVAADADALAEVLLARDVAALILEPTGAAWGTVPLEDGFLATARRLADETGTLLVFDEVVSCFRWAPGGVQELTGVVPDLTVLGKVLAGGMPGGAVCGRTDLMDLLSGPAAGPRRVTHPGTHNAHPLSAAAGIATLGLAATGSPQAHADRLAAWLRDELTAVFRKRGVAGRAFGQSSTFHLLFGHEENMRALDAATLKASVPPATVAAALQCAMLTAGVHLFHGSGFLSSAHGEREIELTVRAFATALEQLQAEGLV
jgi:glutamate-1-semialdehyde 2,1-aminomutase